jgi:WD40 repeat protein
MFRQLICVVFISLFCRAVAQQKPKLVLQAGHTDQINSINFSPDEKHVVSAGRGGDVRVWETYSGRLQYTIELPQGLMVTDARYHANGREVLITCFQRSTDAHLYIWHPETGNKGLMPLSSSVMASEIVICRGDSLALVRYPDGATELVEMPVGVKLLQMFPLQGHTININAAAVGAKHVFAPKYSDTAYIFDRATKKSIKTLSGIKVIKSAFSADGKILTVITPTKALQYNAATWAVITEKKMPAFDEGPSFQISADGNTVLCYDYNRVYHVELNKPLPPKEIAEARAEKYSSRIVGANINLANNTHAICYETGFILTKTNATTDSIYYYEGLTFSPTGRYFLAKNRQNISLFKTGTNSLVTTYTSGMQAIYGNGIANNGFAYFNMLAGQVYSLDINKQNITNNYTLPAKTNPLYGFTISPVSNLMAYWEETKTTGDFLQSNNTLKVIHLPTGKVVGVIDGFSFKGDLLFSPDGEKIIIRTKSQTQLVNCRTGKKIFSVQTGSKKDIYSVPAHFSYSSNEVAVFEDKQFKLEGFDDAEGGTYYLADTVEAGSEQDGYMSDGNDENDLEIYKQYITVFDTKTGKPIIKIPLGQIEAKAVGIVGKYVYAQQHTSINIYSTQTGKLLYGLKQDGQWPAAICPLQNNMLAVGYSGKALRIFQLGDDRAKPVISKTEAKTVKIVPLEGEKFITLHADYTYTLWQKAERLEKLYTVTLKGDCKNMWVSEERDEVLALTRDYFIDKYRLSNGKFIGTFIITGDGSLVSFDADGDYKAAANTSKYMAWEIDGNLYDFDQWDVQYNRPDKVLKAMGCPDKELMDAFTKARSKRLRRMGVSEKQLQTGYQLPLIQLNNKTQIEGETVQPTTELDITAWDDEPKNTLSKIIISVNGNPIHGTNGWDISAEKLNKKTIKIPVQLSAGINAIKISCINNQGVESLREAVYISYEPTTTVVGKTWFIGIGVSQYADAKHNLTYAKKDAGDMATAFAKNKNVQTIIITDKEATKENILALKSKLIKETTVNDAVIVSLSGHGIIDDDYNFYFATHDVDFKRPAAKGLSYNDILWLLDSLPVRNKLVLMDACHSGELDKEEIAGIKELNEHPADTNVRATRSGIELLVDENENKGLGLGSTFELMQELFANIGRGNGATIISAAAGTEFAFEGNKWKNGVFTYCVLKGLTEKLADANNDGKISVTELQNYVSAQVQQLTNGRQRPVGRQTNFDNDWVVWR